MNRMSPQAAARASSMQYRPLVRPVHPTGQGRDGFIHAQRVSGRAIMEQFRARKALGGGAYVARTSIAGDDDTSFFGKRGFGMGFLFGVATVSILVMHNIFKQRR